MPLLPRFRQPFITLDDLRLLAARLSKTSRQQFLRHLQRFPRPRPVWRWDAEIAVVTEIVIDSASMGRWRLRYHDQHDGWTMKPVARPRRAPLTLALAGDVLIEYHATYRALLDLKQRLKTGPRRRRPWSHLEACAELRRLLGLSSAEDGPLAVDKNVNVVVPDIDGTERPTRIPFRAFHEGDFSASALAKEIVAARHGGAAPTLERVLRRATTHYQQISKAKLEARRARG